MSCQQPEAAYQWLLLWPLPGESILDHCRSSSWQCGEVHQRQQLYVVLEAVATKGSGTVAAADEDRR